LIKQSAGSLSDDTVPSDHKKSRDDNKEKEDKEKTKKEEVNYYIIL